MKQSIITKVVVKEVIILIFIQFIKEVYLFVIIKRVLFTVQLVVEVQIFEVLYLELISLGTAIIEY